MTAPDILRTPIKHFDILPSELCLAAVLPSGQSFRWIKSIPAKHTLPEASSSKVKAEEEQLELNTEWVFPSRDRLIYLRQDRSRIWYTAAYTSEQAEAHALDLRADTTYDWLKTYFSLDVSLSALYEHWCARDVNFAKKTENGRFAGIRVLKQDPYETLISFICSSNNNIGRITLMLSRLCARLGTPLAPHLTSSSSVPMYAFPPPSTLTPDTTEDLLRELGFGYRAAYIYKTALLLLDLAEESQTTPDAYLHSLSLLEESKAKEALLEFTGVGPKVADCVLLFGLGFDGSVPVDTHVYQIAIRDYGYKAVKGASIGKDVYEKVGKRLKEVWGVKQGWAQQILFTADLKAFSEWMDPLATPASTPAATPKKEKAMQELFESPLPSHLASPGTGLVTPSAVKIEEGADYLSVNVLENGLTLAERVKGRARRKASESPSPSKKVKRED